MIRTLIFALFVVFAAAIPASPEPEMDPMGGQLYVVAAGRERYRSTVARRALRNGMKICPSDYRNGLSIFCDLQGRKAIFSVNGSTVRVERSAPFYIKGDFRKTVTPWTSYPAKAAIKCKVGRESVERTVEFGC